MRLTLRSEKGELTIHRSEGKKGSKKVPSEFYFVDETGTRSEDEGELHKRLGLGAKDFMASVYLHQEVIRDILVNETRHREDAFNRLLGLSGLRDLQNALKGFKSKDFLSRIEDTYEDLGKLIEDECRRYERSIAELQADGGAKGIEAAAHSMEGFQARCSQVPEMLADIAADAGLEPVAIDPPRTPGDFASFQVQVEREIDRLRCQNPAARSQEALIAEREALNLLEPECQARLNHLGHVQKELRDLEREVGDLPRVEAAISELREKESHLKTELELAEDRFLIWKDTADYLAKLADQEATSDCPACGQPIVPAKVLSTLEERKKASGAQVAELEGEINTQAVEIQKLDRQLRRLRDFRDKQIPEARNAVSETVAKVTKALEREIAKDDDPLVLIRNRRQGIERELGELQDPLGRYTKRLAEVGSTLGSADLIRQIVFFKLRIERIQEVTDSPEWEAMNERRDAVFGELEAVEKVSKAVDEAIREVNREKLEAAGSSIEEYYRVLIQRPDFESVAIDAAKGHQVFAVQDGERENVVSFFSQGDMNCVALSIFLALGGARTAEGPAFLMLDDPSQSLDADQQARLANLLNRVAEGSQIVLATMDERLRRACETVISKRKQVYTFGVWDPAEGPSIVQEG